MPKRKRRWDGLGPSRKSARIAETVRQPASSSPVTQSHDDRREREKNKRPQVLLSPSASGSVREGEDCPQAARTLEESNPETSINDETRHQSSSAKPRSQPFVASTGWEKRKLDEEVGVIQSCKHRRRECEPVELVPKQSSQQFEEAVSQPGVDHHIPTGSLAESPKGPDAQVSERGEGKRIVDPISYWAAHSTWPDNFQENVPMALSGNSSKRPRTLSSQNPTSERRSYTQAHKYGQVPEQYTSAYEKYIFTKGLDMDVLRGEEYVSEDSNQVCESLFNVTRHNIQPTVFPEASLRKVINLLATRNEAIVNRDITTMIVPPVLSLYFGGADHLEHVVDEVNTNWYEQCVLAGPQLRPDLALGLSASCFTEAEIDKLKRYTSVDNWTQFTSHMYFPFLMCEVKSGREGLNVADRQNMHSCSVAVRALLRIVQEADKYRSEAKLQSLSGHVVVLSISHDQQDVRLYGHFARVQQQQERWTYHRYCIGTFNILTNPKALLVVHNFVHNLLATHVANHVTLLKDCLSALPEPSALSDCASNMSLNDTCQSNPQVIDADGFVVPPLPRASRSKETTRESGKDDELVEQIMKQNEQISKLVEQLEEERKKHEEERRQDRERLKQESKEQIDQLWQDSEKRERLMERQVEEQKQQMEEQRRQMEEQQKEIISLLSRFKN